VADDGQFTCDVLGDYIIADSAGIVVIPKLAIIDALIPMCSRFGPDGSSHTCRDSRDKYQSSTCVLAMWSAT